ncbi:MAG: hypothetical protein ACI9VN_001150, partial [Patescibacteria group bacterium]
YEDQTMKSVGRLRSLLLVAISYAVIQIPMMEMWEEIMVVLIIG